MSLVKIVREVALEKNIPESVVWKALQEMD